MLLNEFRLAIKRKEIWWIFTIGMIIAFAGIPTTLNFQRHRDFNHLENAYQAALIYGYNTLRLLLMLLIPIMVALSYADSYFVEKQSGVSAYLLIRVRKTFKYYFNKWIVILVLSFLVVIIPLLVNQLLCLYVFPKVLYTSLTFFTPYDFGFLRDADFMTYPYHAAIYPLATNLIYIGLAGIYGATMALIAFSLTLFYQENRAAIIFLPIAIALAMELIAPSFGYKISPIQALAVKTVDVGSIIPMALLLISVIIISFALLFVKARKDNI